uniref:Death domain-containing protein n=1 Tax=Amphimedon queenslandica TaxID=400682 RepID=A0A1X7TM76_AMPQE
MATKTSSCSSSLSLFSSPLTIEQLIDVLNLLKRCGFPQRRWKELGLTLGLHKNTLDAIERNHPGDVSGCLTECLSQWLSRADNVDSKGGATFDSLSDALKSMNENAAAEKLDQEKHNAMISGNDIKGTNDVHSTATGANKPLIGGPPLSPIALMDIPDDILKVSELIEIHELLIKGQLEESLPLFDADTIRKIRNAASDGEGMSLLRKAFEEHPTLLHEMRVATEKIKGSSQRMPKSPPPVSPKPRSLSQSGRSQSLTTANKPRPLSQTAQLPPTAPKPRRLSLTTQPPPKAPKPHRSSITEQSLPKAQPPTTAPKPHRPSISKKPPPPAPKPRQSQDSSSAPHDPIATVLQDEGKKDPSSFKPMEGSMPPEYITMKEMLADLVDLLAGNAPVISQLNNHLFSSDLIPKAVHVTVENTAALTPYDRANKIFSSVLATLKYHPNPNSVFSSLITSLQKVGLKNMASKLMKNLKMKGGHVDPNLKQQPSVSKGPLQPVDVTAQSHTPQPTITGSQSSTPTTVIELSSKSEVAANIKSLHSRFASLVFKMRGEFEELVEKNKVRLIDIARRAAIYLKIPVSSLKYGDVDELFDSLQPHYDFFSCGGVLQHLTDTSLSKAQQTELTRYIDSVDKFSESSQLKHIRSTIKEKLSSLPAAASPTTSDQTKLVVIKLNDRWEEMTISKLKTVLKHFFGVTSNLFSHISFDYGSVVITLSIPTSQSQSLIDAINNKTNSMKSSTLKKRKNEKREISFKCKQLKQIYCIPTEFDLRKTGITFYRNAG